LVPGLFFSHPAGMVLDILETFPYQSGPGIRSKI
jgi:hypothetical protein